MAIEKALMALLAGWCLAPAVQASTGCDATLTAQYKQYVPIVEALRADKPGQMRVFAADGSEFTGGQAHWMQGQLRDVEQACARGDQTAAQRQLNAVGQLLKAHARGS
jgi:hypothetical protein